MNKQFWRGIKNLFYNTYKFIRKAQSLFCYLIQILLTYPAKIKSKTPILMEGIINSAVRRRGKFWRGTPIRAKRLKIGSTYFLFLGMLSKHRKNRILSDFAYFYVLPHKKYLFTAAEHSAYPTFLGCT